MFDEPAEDPTEDAIKPADRAKDKSDEFRMHAELCAVFEGHRKFDADLVPKLDPEIAREIQRGMARLEKAKTPDSPVLPEESADQAVALLNLPVSRKLTTNNYHIHRRPGEVGDCLGDRLRFMSLPAMRTPGDHLPSIGIPSYCFRIAPSNLAIRLGRSAILKTSRLPLREASNRQLTVYGLLQLDGLPHRRNR